MLTIYRILLLKATPLAVGRISLGVSDKTEMYGVTLAYLCVIPFSVKRLKVPFLSDH